MNALHTDAGNELAGRRRWLGLAVLGLPTILLSIDLGVLYLALPKLSLDLGPTSTQSLWIMDIYGLMIASFLVTMGRLGDRIGRRRLLIIGSAAFGVMSIVAAFSTSPAMLIAARALLGVSAATLAPSTLALISNMFTDAKERGVAIGVWMSCFMGGSALGPVVGGLLLNWFWWGAAFLVSVPVIVLVLVLAPVLLPESRDPDPGRLDPVSVVLSLATILPIIYGIKEISHDGASLSWLLLVVFGVVVGVFFVRRQRAQTHPLIDVRLFAIPTFSGAVGLLILGPAIMGGIGLVDSQFLQLVKNLTPLDTGLLLILPTAATIAGTLLAPKLAPRLGTARVLGTAGMIIAVGGLLMSQITAQSNVWLLVGGLCLVSFGFGPMGSLGTGLVIGSAPPEKAGSAASISSTSSELGIALGVGLLGLAATTVYRDTIGDTLPAGLPASAAAGARDSITGAVSAASSLPGHGTAMLDAARVAFSGGFDVVAASCGGIGVLLALIAVVLLRQRRQPPQETGEEQTTSAAAG